MSLSVSTTSLSSWLPNPNAGNDSTYLSTTMSATWLPYWMPTNNEHSTIYLPTTLSSTIMSTRMCYKYSKVLFFTSGYDTTTVS